MPGNIWVDRDGEDEFVILPVAIVKLFTNVSAICLYATGQSHAQSNIPDRAKYLRHHVG